MGLFAITHRIEYFHKMALDTPYGLRYKGVPSPYRFIKPFIFNMFHTISSDIDRLDSGENPPRASKFGHYGYQHLWRKLWITTSALWGRFSGSAFSLEPIIPRH
jgi:hypothetical protein